MPLSFKNNNMQNDFFETRIELLRNVGPQRGQLLNTELQIFTFGDLIQYYPFRYEDRTQFHYISDLTEDMEYAQIKGRLRTLEKVGEGFQTKIDRELLPTGQVQWN